jgi:hypothetical protein
MNGNAKDMLFLKEITGAAFTAAQRLLKFIIRNTPKKI